ncbi:MAG: YybS family protein [Candidatus Cloacimonetes bacterium]|nr:YybS family protein [Candidatus Cloacimonadota bacterium]
MILIALLSIVIATFSPFWGLIFIITFSDKYKNKKNLFYYVYIGFAIALFIFRVIDVISVIDLIIGVGLTSALFLWSLQRTLNFINALISVFFLNVIYASMRVVIFGKQYAEIIAQVMEKYNEFLTQTFQNNSEKIDLTLKFTETFQEFFTKYYAGIWVFTIVLAAYIGTLLLAKKGNLGWEHRKIRMPYYLIYSMIFALVGFLWSNSRVAGINAIIMITPLLLIQGLSIIDFYWGDFFKRSKFLLFLLIFSMVVNYFILILVGLIGLTDIWFNFRKIDMEDINESNLN